MTAINFPSSPSNGDTFVAGSVTYTYNSTKQYWDALPTAPLNTNFFTGVTKHITPGTDNTYDLGSSTHKWRSLYVDAGTINIGTQTIKATSSGIQLPELTIGTGTTTVKLGVAADGSVTQTSTVSGTAAAATTSVALTDLSVTSASASGGGALAYASATGAFTYTPPDLTVKAPLDAPTFTGVPAAPTASAATNTTQLATTAFVATAVAGIVDTAPATLNTLNEIAAALGDDANYAATTTTAIGLKAPLANAALTGAPTAPTASSGDDSTKVATTAFVTAALGSSGGGAGGAIDLVADGAITVGKAVTLKASNGKAFAVQAPISTYSSKGRRFGVGTGISTILGGSGEGASDPNGIWYDPNIDRMIWAVSTASGDVGIGAVNSSTGNVTFTSPQGVANYGTYPYRKYGFYDSDLSRTVVFGYNHSTDKIHAWQDTFTTSNITNNVAAVDVTAGDTTDWESHRTFIIAPLPNSKYLLAYIDPATSKKIRLNIIEATASGFTIGTPITVTTDAQVTGSSYSGAYDLGYSSHSGKAYIYYLRDSDSTWVYDYVDFSGSSPTVTGSPLSSGFADTTYRNDNRGEFIIEGKYVLNVNCDQSNRTVIIGGEINSTTGAITFGTPIVGGHTQGGDSTPSGCFVGPVGDGYFSVGHSQQQTATQNLTYYGGKIGTSGAITATTSFQTISTSAGQSGQSIYPIVQNRKLNVFNLTSRTSGTGLMGIFAATSQNVGYGGTSWHINVFTFNPYYVGASNFAEWIGIAGSTVSDGATVTVTLPGGINDQQSGMTTEGTYYVQAADGAISTSVTTEQAGVALSATKLLVTDNTENANRFLTTAGASSSYLTATNAAGTYAPLANAALTGAPTAPTAASGNNSTQIATTAFVTAASGSGGFEAVADGSITAGKAVTLEAATGKVKEVQSSLSFYPNIGTHLSQTYQFGGSPILNYLGSDKFYAKTATAAAYLGNYNSGANTITWSGDLETSVSGNQQGGWSNVVDNHYFYVGTSQPPNYGISSTNQSATLYLSEINVAGNSVNNSVNSTTLESNLSAGSSNSHAATLSRYSQTIQNQAYAIHQTALSSNTYAYAGVNTNVKGVSYGQKDKNALMIVGGTVDTSASTVQGGTMSNTGSAGTFYGVGRALCVPVPGQAGCFVVGYSAGTTILGSSVTDTALATYKVTAASNGTKGTTMRLINAGGSGTATAGGVSMTWDSTNNKMLAIQRSSNSGTIQCIQALTLDFSGGTISASSAVAQSDLSVYNDIGNSGGLGTTGHSNNCIWVASKGYFIIWYDDAANSNYLTYRTITPDYGNNTFTLGIKTVLSSTNITSNSGGGSSGVIYDYDRDRMTVVYKVSQRGTSSFALFALSTIADWVGIAAASVSDGATVSVTLAGSINENQSGMTIEGNYYVQENGTITTATTAYKAGVALSATNLLVHDNVNDEAGSLGASPSLTGVPTAATASVGTNTTQLATTAFVEAATTAKANIAAPTFTGVPAAPTASVGTNTTQLATTAFVLANGAGTSYTAISSATTAVAGNVYIVDTGAAVTVTLPASAAIGDSVAVIDGTGTAATNNITIGRNSHKIQGDAADMTVSLNRAAFELVYYNATHGWLLTKV